MSSFPGRFTLSFAELDSNGVTTPRSASAADVSACPSTAGFCWTCARLTGVRISKAQIHETSKISSQAHFAAKEPVSAEHGLEGREGGIENSGWGSAATSRRLSFFLTFLTPFFDRGRGPSSTLLQTSTVSIGEAAFAASAVKSARSLVTIGSMTGSVRLEISGFRGIVPSVTVALAASCVGRCIFSVVGSVGGAFAETAVSSSGAWM